MSIFTATNIECKDYTIHFNSWDQLSTSINNDNYSKVICIVDDNTQSHCLPILEQKIQKQLNIIIIKSGEKYKTIDTCTKIWKEMMNLGADRYSVVITLGGGVVGDMGGFCAATYMRGMSFVHVPTTLLSQVDSAVGGKLGVDLDGYKNMIGLILNPDAVYIFPEFIRSLPNRELFSGFAEMIKHALISYNSLWNEIKAINPLTHDDWKEDIFKSVYVKYKITEEDPREREIRKKLNFGHTVGHAIESENLKYEFPLLHGEAIAIGMICECHISYQKGILSLESLAEVTQVILNLYDRHPETVAKKENIISNTRHDKKNKGGVIKCTLLNALGNAIFDQEISKREIKIALEYYEGL